MSFTESIRVLRNQGTFSGEFLDRLEQHAISIDKEAAARPGWLAGLGLPLLGALSVSAVSGGIGYLAAKNQYKTHTDGLRDSFQDMIKHRDFSDNPDLFRQRFSELALISPTVASNPRLAERVIVPRLHAGFELEDIHRLSSIEHNTSNTRRVMSPRDAGASAAKSSFIAQLQQFVPSFIHSQFVPGPAPLSHPQITSKGTSTQKKILTKEDLPEALRNIPSMKVGPDGSLEVILDGERVYGRNVQEFKESYEVARKKSLARVLAVKDVMLSRATTEEERQKVNKRFDDMFKQLEKAEQEARQANHEKKSSASPALSVSEECLGKMIADRYVMYKAASAGGFSFARGGAALKGWLQVMGPALVIGGGIKLLQDALHKADDVKLKNEADAVFNHLKKTDETVRHNPVLAAEVFDTLKTFAPSLAVKPIIARTYLKNVIDGSAQVSHELANQLVQAEGRYRDINANPNGGFIEGLKTPMSIFSHSINDGVENRKKKGRGEA